MDLPLPDLGSLSGQQLYYFYGLAVVLLLLLLVVFRTFSASSSGKVGAAKKLRGTSNVLLVGPMGSGKTSLFGRLIYKSPPATHTSLMPSSALIPGKNIQLVDLPGHPRLRSHLLAQYLPSADGVIFTIDPSTNATAQGIQATAEHLHVLLSLINILEAKGAKSLPPVLLLLTKSDTWSAAQKQRAQDRVKTMLERELEKRRKSSNAAGSASARLESIEELPSGSSSNPFNIFAFLWKSSSSSQAGTASSNASGGITLPEDEQEILQTDVLDFEGPFSWDEDKLGIRISWATSSSKSAPSISEKVVSEKGDVAAEKSDSISDEAGIGGLLAWLNNEL